MSSGHRVEILKEVEKCRERPVVVYVTSSRRNASAQMAKDAIPEFIRQVRMIPEDKPDIDLLLVSDGGDPMVSWRIVSILRERFKKVGALLPYSAYSAATLIALGADEIVMHPFSNLGPVDPQLTFPRRTPSPDGHGDQVELLQFGAEDITNFLDFLRSDIGVTDQEQLGRAIEVLCKDVPAIFMGASKRSSKLALLLGEKLLSMHMKDQNKARAITEALNKSFYHHGYPVGPSEAKHIGLPVTAAEGKVKELLWSYWEELGGDMEVARPFNPIELVWADPKAGQLIGPVPQAQIPANLAPQLQQQVLQQILQQIKVVEVPPVDYDLFSATVESVRGRSEFHVKGKISAVRLPDMNIAANVIKTSEGWVSYEESKQERRK